MTTHQPRLNRALDVQALQSPFAREGRIRISDVLDEDFAARTLASLEGDIPWHLMYFNHEGKGKDMVGRLNMSLYGTRAASLNWQFEVTRHLEELGF